VATTTFKKLVLVIVILDKELIYYRSVNYTYNNDWRSGE